MKLKKSLFQIQILFVMKSSISIISLLIILKLIQGGQSQYQPNIASQLAKFSKIAYQQAEKIQNWTCDGCKMGIENVNVVEIPELLLQGYVLYSKSLKAIVVAFRGSKKDIQRFIKQNFNLMLTDYKKCSKCRVHSGFYIAAQKIKQAFIAKLDLLLSKYPKASLYYTGHSFGGSLATLISLEVSQKVKSIKTAIYTFGKPRIGNLQFSKFVSKIIPSYRIINNKDIVPQLPLKIPFLTMENFASQEQMSDNALTSILEKKSNFLSTTKSFYHEGFEIWVNEGKIQKSKQQGQKDSKYNDIWFAKLRIRDHKMVQYLKISYY